MLLQNDLYPSLLELARRKVKLSEITDRFLKAAEDAAKQDPPNPEENAVPPPAKQKDECPS